MNPHSTQILGLVVIAAWAILSANKMKGRLLTLLAILAFMAGGLGVGFAIGHGNAGIRGNAAISLMILLGAVSAIGCLVGNRRSRNKKNPLM
jgi:hypothetical protein